MHIFPASLPHQALNFQLEVRPSVHPEGSPTRYPSTPAAQRFLRQSAAHRSQGPRGGGGGRGGCAHNRPHSPHTRGGLRESAGIVVPHQRQPLRYSGLCGNLGLHYDSCRFPPPSQGSIACCMLNCMNCMNCMLYADVDTLPASRHHPSAAVPSTPSQFHFQTFRQTTSHSPAGNHVAGITGQTASLTGHAHRCMTHSNQITSQRSNGAHMARCSDRHDGRCPLHAAKPFPARMPASVPNNPCVCSNCCR